jgi:leader peptidase (prepilin peptidase) / N-methyltransferase
VKWFRVNKLLDILTAFETQSWLFYLTAGCFGLCVGSFLNVVAYRLPAMMERDWKIQCHDYLSLGEPEFEHELKHLNLSTPASRCPHCGHKIRFWENIPVISYILLRAKCSSCKAPISIQYPLVEAATGLLSLVVAWRFGVTLEMLAALLFTWILIALTLIDLDKQLLPDSLTLPLLWLGLVVNLFGVVTDLRSSVIGAVAGYLVLWSVFHLFRLITGKEGMGYGDFKLLAALGAWMGWQLLPQIVLVSSVVGAVLGISMIVIGKNRRTQPIPFGPYLAIAGWIALLWGQEINHLYLGLIL